MILRRNHTAARRSVAGVPDPWTLRRLIWAGLTSGHLANLAFPGGHSPTHLTPRTSLTLARRFGAFLTSGVKVVATCQASTFRKVIRVRLTKPISFCSKCLLADRTSIHQSQHASALNVFSFTLGISYSSKLPFCFFEFTFVS